MSHHCLARHALCAKKQKRNKKMKEMKINSDLHLSCTPIPLSAAKDKCTSFTWIFFHLQFYSFLLFFVSYTFSKKGPYKSLHFKSLVKMHLFLNYFSLYTDSLVKKIYILQDISLDLPVFFVWPWSASGRNRPFDGTVLLLFEHDLRCPDFAMERPLNRSQGWASPPTLVRSTRDVDMLKM